RGQWNYEIDASLWILPLLVCLPFIVPVAFMLALGLGEACRCYQHAALRRRVSALSPSRRAELLQQLREGASAPAREIAWPLVVNFSTPSELTPAASPEGHGTELTPTG